MKNHTHFKELVSLSACGELEGTELHDLESHLVECGECRLELQQLKQVARLAQAVKVEVTDRLLRDSRSRLHAELLKVNSKPTVRERIVDAVSALFIVPNFKIALGGITMTVFGILIGYALFSPSETVEQSVLLRDTSIVKYFGQNTPSDQTVTKENTRTENIRIAHTDESDGTVEFVFDAVTPMRVTGKMNDKHVQRILARALVDEGNPGVRLRAMNVISSQTDRGAGMETEIKTALLAALKGDENPAVRRQAVSALQQYAHEAQIQRALVYALLHDKNSGVRIAAINLLASASLSGSPMDKSVLNDLKEKVQYDKNVFIRNQSRNVLQEASLL